MEKLNFSVEIKASKEKVWELMLSDANYREWTEVFHEGSHFVGNWEQGSEMQFLGPDGNGGLGGLAGIIEENRPAEFLSIRYLGVVTNGVVDSSSDQVQIWIGSHENYSFTEKDGVTTVDIELDSSEDISAMFEDMWPKGLAKLKEICER
ncbi:uncharacterized protein YndB with AHSA1/START domain [Psychromicrobium silvestre]|uniref:Uncharacterized protein YndB with AHSA1/START domain n=1 Tax=Psychromicrobium silvestre TaxID=1645614 RepID=A0A7Y9S838_9MICC|nr:hypothetical protein [Psychromicrobium silvestre]NYE96095.1 uncharacterized protein YndB with AHSA1/START domain [Psychromicrobium silvestre]